jgi:hypothetical protein
MVLFSSLVLQIVSPVGSILWEVQESSLLAWRLLSRCRSGLHGALYSRSAHQARGLHAGCTGTWSQSSYSPSSGSVAGQGQE